MTIDPGFAPAKVNLALHVVGQRADGYHELDSLVAFADVGDHVSYTPADTLSLMVTGPHAKGVPTDETNLVLKAARFMKSDATGCLNLEKHLPTAAGIGGGSADAAATLRILARELHLEIPGHTAQLGADVPVCLACTAHRMSGIGDVLSPLLGFPRLPVVLVNPGVDVPTGPVFQNLAKKNNSGIPAVLPRLVTINDACDFLVGCRNDLEKPAMEIAPIIQDVFEALNACGARLARMSGSGATCFGIFPTIGAADCAAAELSLNPNWWVTPAVLS